MKEFNLANPTVIYAMDAYCGWCWAFSERLKEFEAENRDRIQFTAISGGLFTGARAQPISAYPHIPEANNSITQMTGAQFSDKYNTLLSKGHIVLNSLDAGAAFAVLRGHDPERAIHWIHELQYAFYIDGLSLSETSTIVKIAEEGGLDAVTILHDLESGLGIELAKKDFALSRELGVSSYPTLLLLKDKNLYQLPATSTELHVLNQKLDELLKD